MFQDGCGLKLYAWFQANKITWVTMLASVVALQIMCIGIAMYILSRVKKMNKLRYAVHVQDEIYTLTQGHDQFGSEKNSFHFFEIKSKISCHMVGWIQVVAAIPIATSIKDSR